MAHAEKSLSKRTELQAVMSVIEQRQEPGENSSNSKREAAVGAFTPSLPQLASLNLSF